MKKILIIPVILLFIFMTSVFVVSEGENGIVMQFGKAKRDNDGKTIVLSPGLHFKFPIIESIKIMDTRIQTLDGQPDSYITSESKYLIIDSFVKWEVEDLATYYLRAGGDPQSANSALKSKFEVALRSEVASHSVADTVSVKRGIIMKAILDKMKIATADLGIKVIDVRIKKINWPDSVNNSVYQRMRTEREAVAKKHRSLGQQKSEEVRAETDSKINIKFATANKAADLVHGQADAVAAEIYASAFAKDPEFYAFMRSLEAYEKTFSNKQDVMVLSPDSDFFKYMGAKK